MHQQIKEEEVKQPLIRYVEIVAEHHGLAGTLQVPNLPDDETKLLPGETALKAN